MDIIKNYKKYSKEVCYERQKNEQSKSWSKMCG